MHQIAHDEIHALLKYGRFDETIHRNAEQPLSDIERLEQKFQLFRDSVYASSILSFVPKQLPSLLVNLDVIELVANNNFAY